MCVNESHSEYSQRLNLDQSPLKAAKLVEKDCDAIDINFGCPQRIAKRGFYGAFLMDNLPLVEQLVLELSKVRERDKTRNIIETIHWEVVNCRILCICPAGCICPRDL